MTNTAQENIAKMPPLCFTVMFRQERWRLATVKAGEMGFWPCQGAPDYDTAEKAQNRADELNEALGITENMAQAMVTGSMFGFGCAGADPGEG